MREILEGCGEFGGCNYSTFIRRAWQVAGCSCCPGLMFSGQADPAARTPAASYTTCTLAPFGPASWFSASTPLPLYSNPFCPFCQTLIPFGLPHLPIYWFMCLSIWLSEPICQLGQTNLPIKATSLPGWSNTCNCQFDLPVWHCANLIAFWTLGQTNCPLVHHVLHL